MKRYTLLSFLCLGALSALAQRTQQTLTTGWTFAQGDVAGAEAPDFNDAGWKRVSVPHDWAITGPFDRKNDLQIVAVTQNGETEATEHTGRTGGLPYVGVGWYRCKFRVDGEEPKAGRRAILVFDGAMSQAKVFVNGKEAIFWPFGYNTFYCDVTDLCTASDEQQLAVRLENVEQSSRWYSGAGLFRNVHLIETEAIHVPIWGTQVTTELHTPPVPQEGGAVVLGMRAGGAEGAYASITLKTHVEGCTDTEPLTLYTEIIDDQGKVVAAKEFKGFAAHGLPLQQNFTVEAPHLWSPETPNLYRAVTRIYAAGRLQDTYTTRFGIRSLEYVADKGFFLNGERRKFQGVCNHHDLGPLGAAVNRTALRHQLQLLKDMGCDAIRTSHNMPAPELVELCDEMGFMMMLEPFDEWEIAKCKGGYHRWFFEPSSVPAVSPAAAASAMATASPHPSSLSPLTSSLSPLTSFMTWAEADLVNMLRHYRNNPSVVMWSIGNEVPTQGSPEGYKVASWMRDICHREDPTRPVTSGMDQVDNALNKGFAAVLDIPGFNYRADRYEEAYRRLPQGLVLGSETASTVSSRGVYKFPAEKRAGAMYPDHQSSSYDLESCWWSNIPDVDFANADDHDWTLGQFVWTGFDYLGEPSPYDTDAWPSHSSLFGIIDLASIPKDRYWLYRSVWNKTDHTLHVLPHWTWPGREGEVTPVFVYTDAPAAELFVNGKSQGVQRKKSREEASDVTERYRLMWNDVRYEPGEITVKALYPDNTTSTATVRTAGAPHHIEVVRQDAGDRLAADGQDLAYFTIRIVDKDGNLCPDADALVKFDVKGNGSFRAAANGDATNLDLFHLPQHHAFHGQLTAIVQAGTSSLLPPTSSLLPPTSSLLPPTSSLSLTLTASAKGLKSGSATVGVGTERKADFVKGADIGWKTEMESKGEVVRDAQGNPTEMTQLMKDYGCGAVRCRVWLDPSKHGGWCNKEDVLQKCLRAKELGMDVMIDFHYSDWWCDPAKQPVPHAWSGHNLDQLKQDLRAHTVDVLSTLKAHGITPKWVQVGNETTYGFLWSVKEDPATGWPTPEVNPATGSGQPLNVITEAIARIDRPGKQTAYYAPGVTSGTKTADGTPVSGVQAYAQLFKEGYDAVKSVCPKAQVIVHLDDGFDQELFDWNLQTLRDGGAKWDVIGMSLYTYWAINEGKRTNAESIVDECMANIRHLYDRFGTPSMLVEVGMDAMNPDEGSRILKKILHDAQHTTDGHCLGAFYWEPACRPSQYRLGAFDEAGRPTKIMETFKNY